MRQIRRCVFETNSSSTHSLSMTNKPIDDAELESDIFEKVYVIKRFSKYEIDDIMEFTTVEDKLRYFLTLYYQTMYSDYYPDTPRMMFMKMLKKIFPNAIFELDFEYCYAFEDGEYFFDDENPECIELIDEDRLKRFMLYGTINFGDRNRESYSDKINNIRYNKNLWSVSWSG